MKLFLFAALFLADLVGLVTPADLVIRIPGNTQLY